MKTVLVDTNILIRREDGIVERDIQELSKILNSTKVRAIIHPSSLIDIKKDKNKERMRTILSKVSCYPLLESPPSYLDDTKFRELLKIDKVTNISSNDEVDNQIIYSLYSNRVDLVVTEDKGIHSKARDLDISDKVLTVSRMLKWFEKEYPVEKGLQSPPAIKYEPINSSYLSQGFFNSLREDYDGFDKWFVEKCTEENYAYLHRDKSREIKAFLMLKKESRYEEPSGNNMPRKDRIKIRTLKVSDNGKKIGELFIKLAIKKAIKEDLDEIYLTHFVKPDDPLIKLITNFGFCEIPKFRKINDKGEFESVFVKRILCKEEYKRGDYLEFNRIFFPSFYDGILVNRFIVPIRPEYHMRLFTDYPKRQLTLAEHAGEFIIEGNTIEKAYICNSRIKRIKRGDILLFYRSKDDKEITSLGIVDKVEINPDFKRIQELTTNRTVYKEDNIKKMNPNLVILFKHNFHLPKRIGLKVLHNKKILKGNIYQTREISYKNYLKLKRLSGLPYKFTLW